MNTIDYKEGIRFEVVNAKFNTRIDRMIWGLGQYSANFNGGDRFAPDKYLTDYYTDEALSFRKII